MKSDARETLEDNRTDVQESAAQTKFYLEELKSKASRYEALSEESEAKLDVAKGLIKEVQDEVTDEMAETWRNLKDRE